MIRALIDSLPAELPVLIAGPTASGKSAMALAIAEAQGGTIINADASQVYDCWRILTARPSPEDEHRAPHAMYGHISYDTIYSVGHWLREITPLLSGDRPIIVGGTGLYFSALTSGLADIPDTPMHIRAEANSMTLDDLVSDMDLETRGQIDISNRMRVQRAWEVLKSTGTGLAVWQSTKTEPLLPAGTFAGLLMESPSEWLTPRLSSRFDQMLECGGLEEARAMQARYDRALPSCRAIGVAQAMAVVAGEMSKPFAVEAATIATRQYAKRQRTWFRSRMTNWRQLSARDIFGD